MVKRNAALVVVIMAALLALFTGQGSHQSAPSQPHSYGVWHPKAEDDYPACWREYNNSQPGGTEEICGPMSLMDPATVIPNTLQAADSTAQKLTGPIGCWLERDEDFPAMDKTCGYLTMMPAGSQRI